MFLFISNCTSTEKLHRCFHCRLEEVDNRCPGHPGHLCAIQLDFRVIKYFNSTRFKEVLKEGSTITLSKCVFPYCAVLPALLVTIKQTSSVFLIFFYICDGMKNFVFFKMSLLLKQNILDFFCCKVYASELLLGIIDFFS